MDVVIVSVIVVFFKILTGAGLLPGCSIHFASAADARDDYYMCTNATTGEPYLLATFYENGTAAWANGSALTDVDVEGLFPGLAGERLEGQLAIDLTP